MMSVLFAVGLGFGLWVLVFLVSFLDVNGIGLGGAWKGFVYSFIYFGMESMAFFCFYSRWLGNVSAYLQRGDASAHKYHSFCMADDGVVGVGLFGGAGGDQMAEWGAIHMYIWELVGYFLSINDVEY